MVSKKETRKKRIEKQRQEERIKKFGIGGLFFGGFLLVAFAVGPGGMDSKV